MAKKKMGNQKPTAKVILPYRKTEAEVAKGLYEKSGKAALPWQESLMKHILAKNKEGLWVHTKFGYAVPRRNGKNEILVMREFYGLEQGERILHTAHRTTTSHAAWERLLKTLEAAGLVAGEDFTSLRATGRERVELVATGGRVEFRTRTSTGGLGEGFDLLIIDEAQEYTDDQESALKYVVSDSQNPQTLLCGTPPTPISSGTVFTKYREKTLEKATPNGGWAEWSVPEVSDIHDRALWAKTNPSLGHILTERAILDETGSDEIDFNIQRLGLWIKYNQKSAISATEWEELQVGRLPTLVGKLYIGIKYGHDGERVAMSLAVRTKDGRIFVETLDCQGIRQGNGWIIDFLRTADIAGVVVDGASGQGILAAEMKEARLRAPTFPTVKEIIQANAAFERGVFSKGICHKAQPSLSQVVTNCEKRSIGASGGFGYRSQLEDAEIALMDSVILAHWACLEGKEPQKQRIMY